MLRISATSASCRKRGPSIARQSAIAAPAAVRTVHNSDGGGRSCGQGQRSRNPVGDDELLNRWTRWGERMSGGAATELASGRAARLAPPRWLDTRLVLGILLVLFAVVAGAR